MSISQYKEKQTLPYCFYMIDETLVQKWISTAQNIPEGVPRIPKDDKALLSLRVVLEEVFEQAEACGEEILKKFCTLVQEEVVHQEERLRKKEPLHTGIIALRDAIADTLVTVCNMPTYANLMSYMEPDYKEVMRSNFSKFCKSEAEAHQSVARYADEKKREALFKKQGDFYVIFDAHTGKILKGISYQEPNIQ